MNEALRQYRSHLQLNQAAMAAQFTNPSSGQALSQGTWANYENGVRTPTPDIAGQIVCHARAQGYALSMEEIYRCQCAA